MRLRVNFEGRKRHRSNRSPHSTSHPTDFKIFRKVKKRNITRFLNIRHKNGTQLTYPKSVLCAVCFYSEVLANLCSGFGNTSDRVMFLFIFMNLSQYVKCT